VSDDFITRLERELTAAELRELTRRPVLRRLRSTRLALRGPLLAAAAVALVAVAVALIATTLSSEDEVARPAPKFIRTFPVANALSSLASGHGSVWAGDPVRGQVLRIDPRTDRVVARVPAGTETVVAAGAGSVWALTGDLLYGGDQGPVRVLRIDPATNRVAARIPVDRDIVPNGLRLDGDAVWVVGATGMQRVDVARDTAAEPVELAGESFGVVVDGDTAWTLTRSGRLRRLDTRSGRVMRELPVEASPGAVLSGEPGLLLLQSRDRLARLDERSGEIVWSVALGGGLDVTASGAGGTIWAHQSDGVLVRLDSETGKVIAAVRMPADRAAGIAESGGDRVWVAGASGSLTVASR
jgi:hypothetical protein